MNYTYIYSCGLCGYLLREDPEDSGRIIAHWSNDEDGKERSYKVQMAPSGRTFIRPYGNRVYLDQCMRCA